MSKKHHKIFGVITLYAKLKEELCNGYEMNVFLQKAVTTYQVGPGLA